MSYRRIIQVILSFTSHPLNSPRRMCAWHALAIQFTTTIVCCEFIYCYAFGWCLLFCFLLICKNYNKPTDIAFDEFDWFGWNKTGRRTKWRLMRWVWGAIKSFRKHAIMYACERATAISCYRWICVQVLGLPSFRPTKWVNRQTLQYSTTQWKERQSEIESRSGVNDENHIRLCNVLFHYNWKW